MKNSLFSPYSFLLLLLILLVIVCIIEIRKKRYLNKLNSQVPIIEKFKDIELLKFEINKALVIDPEKLDSLLEKVDLEKDPIEKEKINENIIITREVKDKINKKILYIEGKKLNSIKNVFFGNFNGTIIEAKQGSVVNNKEVLYILPPDFRKYKNAGLDYNNLEIKFLIVDKEIINDPVLINQKRESNKHILVFSNNNLGNNDYGVLKSNLSFKLKSDIDVDFNLKINGNQYGPYSLSKGIPNQFDFNLNLEDIRDIVINVETEDLGSEDINFPSPSPTSSDDQNNFQLTDSKLTFMFDDIYTVFPSGLFYNITNVKSYLERSEAWNIYLDNDKDRVFDKPEVQMFYQNMKNILEGAEKNNKEKIEEPVETYNPKNLSLTIDEKDDDLMNLKWGAPDKQLNNDFSYVLNVEPLEINEEIPKDFSIKNKKIIFEDTNFVFSNVDMVPLNTYKISLKVYNFTNSKIIGESIINYKYEPENLEKYHSHIFKDGKFNTELTVNNPELVKTYYQLNAFNKMKTQDNLLATSEHIQASSKCMSNNLNKINTNASKDKYDSSFEELLRKDQEEQAVLFSKKQNEQKEDMERLNNKIAELEAIQGKLNKNQNTKIKSIKSMNDGTNLSLLNLENNKKMVKLNQGCLSRTQDGDYKYIPCNVLDKSQYFILDKINNVDEYNNLLMMNNNMPTDEKMSSPFYVLQPENSVECVSVDNKKLSIKPCTNDNTIKYTGNFVNQKCSI